MPTHLEQNPKLLHGLQALHKMWSQYLHGWLPIPLHPHYKRLIPTSWPLLAILPPVASVSKMPGWLAFSLHADLCSTITCLKSFSCPTLPLHCLPNSFYFNFLQSAYHTLITSYVHLLVSLSAPIKNKSREGRDSSVFTPLSPACGTLPGLQMLSKYLLNRLDIGI